MKKRIIVLIVAIAVLITAGAIIVYNLLPRVRVVKSDAELRYVYGGKNIEAALTDEEGKSIKNIFNNKMLYQDSPSCGFSEDVSIKIDGSVFCIACDKCTIIKYEDKYFNISEADRALLDNIFEKYGGVFPCV